MRPESMTKTHDDLAASPWQWRLAPRHARRLAPAPRLRWLAVEEGRVWLTRSQQRLEPGEDLWLSAGERLPLPPGSDWVVEGWPEARLVLMESPDAS